MNGRPWTKAELAKLRKWYGVVPAREIARRLGRTQLSIYQAANVHGLRINERVVTDARFFARLRRLNARHYTDNEIAQELGCERHTVSRHRRQMGLPSRMHGKRMVARVRATTARQCADAGVSSLGEYRALMYRVRAIKAGWPADLRWRAVQILEVLEQRGPMTRQQIAEAIGMPWRGSRKSLVSNDPEGSYLANLQKRGLVVRLGRVVRGDRRGTSVNLYSISVTAQRSVAR